MNPAVDFGDQTAISGSLKMRRPVSRCFEIGGYSYAVSSHAARHVDHVCLSGPSAIDVATAWRTAQWPPVAALIILIAIAFIFSSLTVEVRDRELRWHFGPGFWTYRLALDDIETVEVVRNHWWNGFGIRMRPGFRLYNVSGLDAVELHLRSSEIRRIGTDDPQGLAGALKAAAGAP
jgi:hypothetical protein